MFGLKVVHFVPHLRNTGNGIVNVAVDLACMQAERGYEVAIVGEGGEFERLIARYGVRFIALSKRRGILSGLSNAWTIRRFLISFRPAICHVHVVAGAVYVRAVQFRLPYSVVATGHTAFRRTTALFSLADRVVAVSAKNAQTLASRGIPRNKIVINRNAPLGSPRRQHDNSSAEDIRKPSIVTVSGMYVHKGIDVLIRAFEHVAERHPSATLYLVGRGPDEDQFREQASRSAAADRIKFLGFRSDVDAILRASDVFVLASRIDQAPLVIPEAREAGCAVVASDVDGIPETLDGGQAGMLVAPGDSGAFSAAIDRLLSDGDVLQYWRSAASANLDDLRLARLVNETESMYLELIRRKLRSIA